MSVKKEGIIKFFGSAIREIVFLKINLEIRYVSVGSAVRTISKSVALFPEIFAFQNGRSKESPVWINECGSSKEIRSTALKDILQQGVSVYSFEKLGRSLYDDEMYYESSKIHNDLLRAKPKSVYIYIYIINSYIELGDFNRAFSYYFDCLSFAPQNKHLKNNKIIIAVSKNLNNPVVEKIICLLRGEVPGNSVAEEILKKIYSITSDIDALMEMGPAVSGMIMEVRNVVSARGFIESYGGVYDVVLDQEFIPLAKRKKWRNEFDREYVETQEAYLAKLDDVFIHGGSDLIFGGDSVICDALAHAEYGKYIDLKAEPNALVQRSGEVLIEYQNHQKRVLDAGFMLCGASSKHFGHWFAEYLPKLLCLVQKGGLKSVPLIVDEDLPKQYIQMLESLVCNPIIVISKGERVNVKELWLSPTTTFRAFFLVPGHKVPTVHQGALSPRVLRFLRDKILENSPTPAFSAAKRVYLHRGHNAWRQLYNEELVIELLKKEGFEIVVLSDLSFSEQVNVFRGAEQIVGPNGSSFNNLIYADPAVKITVLQSVSYDWSTGLGSLRALGYQPKFVEDKNSVADSKHRAFEVDPESVLDQVRSQYKTI